MIKPVKIYIVENSAISITIITNKILKATKLITIEKV